MGPDHRDLGRDPLGGGDALLGLPVQRESDHSAWVTITIGCNNSCTFCIVPIVRGPEISRRPGDIIREVQRLADDGRPSR